MRGARRATTRASPLGRADRATAAAVLVSDLSARAITRRKARRSPGASIARELWDPDRRVAQVTGRALLLGVLPAWITRRLLAAVAARPSWNAHYEALRRIERAL